MRTSQLTLVWIVLTLGGILVLRIFSPGADQTSAPFTAAELASYSKTNTAPKVAKPKHEIKVTGEFTPEHLASLLAHLESASFSTNRVQRIDFRHPESEPFMGNDSDRDIHLTAVVQMSRSVHSDFHPDTRIEVYYWWHGGWVWSIGGTKGPLPLLK